MTDDDLEPRLSDHLRQRAARVSAPPDVADVHHRVDARNRRTTRALGAALALALVAGPLVGWVAARSSEPDVDTVTVSGPGGSASADNASTEDSILEGESPGYLDPEMELVSKRTTGDGVRLVVRSTVLGHAPDEPCAMDGLVRVGIVDGDLIDVALFQTAPGGAAFGIAGGADGRPMWVVVARAVGTVEATFPNGATDSTEAVSGVAVLAAYADEGQDPLALTDDVVQVSGLPGTVSGEGPRDVTVADGTGGCPPGSGPVGPPVDQAMPEPGEPPADESAARIEVEQLFLEAMDGAADPAEAHLREHPPVWLEAQQRFQQEHPEYYEWSHSVYSEVHEIVFTAPDRASVRYSLVTDDPEIPAPGERIGEAVLLEGSWRISIDTSCGNLALAGIECDYSLQE